MKNSIKTVFLTAMVCNLAFSILAGCTTTTVQKQPVEQKNEQKKASYEEDVYPYIIEQINNTASTFFYDNSESDYNVIVGDNEIPGFCRDYVFHFIDNYKGPGVVFYLSSSKGKAFLERRVKLFEKNDIIIQDKKAIYLFINDEDYQVKRNIEKEEQINYYYNDILNVLKDNKEFEQIIFSPFPHPEWSFVPIQLHAKDGKLFLMENTDIPIPESHAGATKIECFSNHAWVRIIWNGMTIDVDPTWYDNGLSLEQVIEIK